MRIAIFYCAAGTGGLATLKIGGPPEAVCIAHGLSSLSTTLKAAGHQPFCVDTRSFDSPTGLALAVRRINYGAAIIWAGPDDTTHAEAAAKIIRSNGQSVPTLAAGPWVSVRSANARVDGITCILRGEPDAVIVDLVSKFEHGQPYPPEISTLDCPPPLDSIAEIDWQFFNANMQTKSPQWLPGAKPHFFTWQAGRSCPGCGDATLLGRKFRCIRCGEYQPRFADPKKMVGAIHRLAGSDGTGGIGLFAFHDTGRAGAKWLRTVAEDWTGMLGAQFPVFLPVDPFAICEDPGIVTEWRKCGLEWIAIDALCGNDAIRAVAGEKATADTIIQSAEIVHRNRVNLLIHVAVGLPGESPNDVLDTERLMQACQPQAIDARVWPVSPGSMLWACGNARGQIADANKPTPFGIGPYWRVKGVDYSALQAQIATWAARHVKPVQCVSLVERRDAAPVDAAVTAPRAMDPTPPQFVAQEPTRVADWREDAIRQVDALLAAESGSAPKVTVITAVHRQLEFLKEAFASIEAQTLRAKGGSIEWIVVESCSPRQDLRVWLAHKTTMKLDNLVVRVVNLRENVNNIAVSWNLGLDLARGEHVCLLDADNRKRPEFLERLCGWLDAHPDRNAVRCKTQNIDAMGTPQDVRGNPGELELAAELASNWVDSGEIVFRRSLVDRIGPFDDRMKACEDWDFVARIVARAGGIGFVDAILTEKRSHPGNRLLTSHALGAAQCTELLRKKNTGSWLSTVRVIAPSHDRLTASQRQVIAGVESGLGTLSFVRLTRDVSDHADFEFVVAPFMLHGPEIDSLFERVKRAPAPPQVVSIHMEDPQAIQPNMRMVGRADWVVANDVAAWRHYRAHLAPNPEKRKRVLLWNSLGAPKVDVSAEAGRDIDVVILGYPYPSRAELARAFLRAAPTSWRVFAVGDGWEKALAGLERKTLKCRPTMPESDTVAVLRRARLCLLAHRGQGDIGGFPSGAPESVHRGFLEAACGAVPFMDRSRGFGLGRMRAETYADGVDAASKAFALLKDREKLADMHAWNLTHADEWTWMRRAARIMHAIRTERYEAWVP